MTPIADLSRVKAAMAVVLLGGGSIFILSQPLREPGGLAALMAWPDDDRYWWPILAVSAVMLIPLMAAFGVKAARLRGPAVFIDQAGLHIMGWKTPIPAREISGVSTIRSRFPVWRPARVIVHLQDGSRRQIHTIFLRDAVVTVAERIATALGLPPPERD